MTKRRHIPLFWRAAAALFFLLCSGGVGISATEVGGSGGYGTSNYRYSYGCLSREIEHSVWNGSQRYRGHVDVDLPGDVASLGVEGGFGVTERTLRSVHTELDSETGEALEASVATIDFQRSMRVHILPRIGVRTRYFEGRLGLGPVLAVGPTSGPRAHVGLSYDVLAGGIGYAAYYGRGELLGLESSDIQVAHGISLLGGDRPAIDFGLRVSPSFPAAGGVPFVELGFRAPSHWVVQPSLRAALGPHEDLNLTSFDVHATVSVLIGKRAKHSERVAAREERRERRRNESGSGDSSHRGD